MRRKALIGEVLDFTRPRASSPHALLGCRMLTRSPGIARSVCLALGLLSPLSLAGCAGHEEASATPAHSDDEATLPVIADFVSEFESLPGFLALWQDRQGGRLYLELGPESAQAEGIELLYYDGLSRGLGANPIGLDRSKIGSARILSLRQLGGRVFFVAQNHAYRASSGDEDEKRAARDAFPSSVLWTGEVIARDDDGSVLVDLTSFLLRDAHGVASHLKRSEDAKYQLDLERSAFEPDASLNFPDNTELEAILTFATDAPGRWSGSTSPVRTALSLRQHLSFVRLPDAGFKIREASSRMGHFSRDHLDFSAPISDPLTRRSAVRHRLNVDEALIYYVDRGTPEPIRSALIEGASWWAKAFEAAGYPGGFEVRLLPEGADPMDVRYNVINWVHRTTRGWSYGASVVDPRTGEILKGHVSLGSQRIRQDRRMFESLLGSAQSGKGGPEDPVELALARVRQLAAHEVGHTLGFEHNFAASSYGRASVMDYPAPLITMKSGRPDFRSAYALGVGRWDLAAFRYLYQEWPSAAEERAGLKLLIVEADNQGLLHLSDAETHAQGASHPEANVWDNDADSGAALRQVLEVRAWGLEHFDETRLGNKAEPHELELTFAPLYFMHRYQLAALAKRLGGERFELGADASRKMQRVPPSEQREAIELINRCLSGDILGVPAKIKALLKPTPSYHIDELDSWSGPNFDPLANAAAAAKLAGDALLEVHRAHRMNLHHARDPASPDFAEVLTLLTKQVFASQEARRHPEIQVVTQQVIADALVNISEDPSASPLVQAQARAAITQFITRLRPRPKVGMSATHRKALLDKLEAWQARPFRAQVPRATQVKPPPGGPIGAAQACGQ